MDRGLKVLVAVTCLAVLAALAWWGWSERQAAQAMAAQAERAAAVEATMRQAEHEAARQKCRDRIAAWDAGDQDALRDEYGTYAEDVVNDCREMEDFWNSTRVAD